MEDNAKNLLSEEHLRRIKYKTGYNLNETPKYHPLVDNLEEFDEIPDVNINGNKDEEGRTMPSPGMTNEVGDQEDAEKLGTDPREPTNDQPIDTNAPPEMNPEKDSMPAVPAPEAGIDVPAPEGGLPPEGELPIDDPMAAAPAPEQQVDTIQNDIIKHNIEAMKGIQTELEGLSTSVQTLNSQLGELNAEVEEVREPTNTEKLMNKKDVSYPYYFNLNDFWDGNWFNQQREGNGEREQGVRELPDGTYIADFDDLPKKSKMDIQDSFNDIG